MIEKLEELDIETFPMEDSGAQLLTMLAHINETKRKINELVDAVNELTSCVGQLGVEFIEPKPVEITEPNIADPYAKQRKWRGKLCKFWDDSDEPENCAYGILVNIFDLHHEDCPFQCESNGEWYEYCEPVKPDDDIIYKGKNKRVRRWQLVKQKN